MKNHDFIPLTLTSGEEMDAYLAFPESNPLPSAVILLQEAFGVNGHIRGIAEKLCKEGYTVIAPDLFHRTIKRADLDYGNFEAVRPHFMAITNEGLNLDLEGCFQYLITQTPWINPSKIASMGFCLGGRVAFLANAFLPLAAGISYYGGGLELQTNQAEKIHGPQLFLWGGKDKNITAEKRGIILEAMDKADKDYTEVVFSKADHAFNCDERANYNPEASMEAWALSLSFLHQKLK
jgi:carboxymethylenebutenolidase